MSRTESAAPICIFGPGLLGGSLALALQKKNPGAEVRICARREDAAADVRARGIAAVATTSVAEAARGAGFVVLATPVETMPGLARQIAACDLASGCVVTDVGSVKGTVAGSLEQIFAGTKASFVGSHPMAGSEKAGIDAARADLFDGSVCIVTPSANSDSAAVELVKSFWISLGCRLLTMSPQEHDRKVARISHLPHVMAAITTLSALRGGLDAIECAGNGFRDTTRVAAGDPGLWKGILLENKAEVTAALREALGTTRELLEIIEGMDEEKLRLFLSEAKNLRDRLAAGATAYGND